MQGRLQTKAKLVHLGIGNCDLCLLCGIHAETHQHFLFNCVYSAACFFQSNTGSMIEKVQHNYTSLIEES